MVSNGVPKILIGYKNGPKPLRVFKNPLSTITKFTMFCDRVRSFPFGEKSFIRALTILIFRASKCKTLSDLMLWRSWKTSKQSLLGLVEVQKCLKWKASKWPQPPAKNVSEAVALNAINHQSKHNNQMNWSSWMKITYLGPQ